MLRSDEVVTRTYVQLPNETPVDVLRYECEEEDDILSVRFGDEGLVLEIEVGLLPRLFQALENPRRNSAKADR